MKRAAPVQAPAWPTLKVEWAGRFASDKDVPEHSHPGCELVLVTEGTCQHGLRLDGTTGMTWLEASAGTLFILPAQVPQVQTTHGFARTTYASFLVPNWFFDERARTLLLPLQDPAARWLEDLCDFFLQPERAPEAVLGSLLLALLERLNFLEHRQAARAEVHPALDRALAVLNAELAEPLDLPELAQRAHVSPSHLTALFRLRFGCGALKYRQELRLQRSARLLQNPYLRVHEAAEACGFEDANYFTRLFTRRFGRAPGQWRKVERNDAGVRT